MTIIGVEIDGLAGAVSEVVDTFRNGSFGAGFLPLPELGPAPAVPGDYDQRWDLPPLIDTLEIATPQTDQPIQDLSAAEMGMLLHNLAPEGEVFPLIETTARVVVRMVGGKDD